MTSDQSDTATVQRIRLRFEEMESLRYPVVILLSFIGAELASRVLSPLIGVLYVFLDGTENGETVLTDMPHVYFDLVVDTAFQSIPHLLFAVVTLIGIVENGFGLPGEVWFPAVQGFALGSTIVFPISFILILKSLLTITGDSNE